MVFVVSVCGDQLHTKLDIRLFRGRGLLDWRLLVNDVAAAAGAEKLVVGFFGAFEAAGFGEQAHGVSEILESDDADETSGVDHGNHTETTAMQSTKGVGQ